MDAYPDLDTELWEINYLYNQIQVKPAPEPHDPEVVEFIKQFYQAVDENNCSHVRSMIQRFKELNVTFCNGRYNTYYGNCQFEPPHQCHCVHSFEMNRLLNSYFEIGQIGQVINLPEINCTISKIWCENSIFLLSEDLGQEDRRRGCMYYNDGHNLVGNMYGNFTQIIPRNSRYEWVLFLEWFKTRMDMSEYPLHQKLFQLPTHLYRHVIGFLPLEQYYSPNLNKIRSPIKDLFTAIYGKNLNKIRELLQQGLQIHDIGYTGMGYLEPMIQSITPEVAELLGDQLIPSSDEQALIKVILAPIKNMAKIEAVLSRGVNPNNLYTKLWDRWVGIVNLCDDWTIKLLLEHGYHQSYKMKHHPNIELTDVNGNVVTLTYDNVCPQVVYNMEQDILTIDVNCAILDFHNLSQHYVKVWGGKTSRRYNLDGTYTNQIYSNPYLGAVNEIITEKRAIVVD